MGAEAVAHPAVLLVPFPAQGHITPMLQLAGVLAAHGVAPTVAVPDFIHRRIAAAASGCVGGGVALASIPSGIVIQQDAAAGGDDDDTPGFRDIVHSMEHHMPLHLERMLLASASPRSRAPPPVACVVVDVLASWAVPVAARCGVPAAGFWPAMLACYRVVAAIPELLDKGLISESGTLVDSDSDEQVVQDVGQTTIRGLEILPAEVDLRVEELPWLVGDSAIGGPGSPSGSRPCTAPGLPLGARQLLPGRGRGRVSSRRCERPRRRRAPPRAAGPACPPRRPGAATGGGILGERTKQQPQPHCGNGNVRKSGPSMWRADATCIGWLDAQRAGRWCTSRSGAGWVDRRGQGPELALGLEATGRPFLWRSSATRPGARAPEGFGPRGGAGQARGLAPQQDVLRHAAVGATSPTAAGTPRWRPSSTGLRLLCYPVSGDQFINCAYITGVWRIGLRLGGGGGGMTRDDVVEGIGRVMDDGGGEAGACRRCLGRCGTAS
ncbi:hypothetical protein BDA96_06G168700 [Sorghum bicolor]|uniref:Glycosyltransferase n=1 Tax=Sorghum bicolor TaxID=4558 RepID=A0A921QTG0_SORBI|nr:hypothetical protein BDA96_06G168700 [Sorghum bicolor]